MQMIQDEEEEFEGPENAQIVQYVKSQDRVCFQIRFTYKRLGKTQTQLKKRFYTDFQVLKDQLTQQNLGYKVCSMAFVQSNPDLVQRSLWLQHFLKRSLFNKKHRNSEAMRKFCKQEDLKQNAKINFSTYGIFDSLDRLTKGIVPKQFKSLLQFCKAKSVFKASQFKQVYQNKKKQFYHTYERLIKINKILQVYTQFCYKNRDELGFEMVDEKPLKDQLRRCAMEFKFLSEDQNQIIRLIEQGQKDQARRGMIDKCWFQDQVQQQQFEKQLQLSLQARLDKCFFNRLLGLIQ